nr:hypothetical protein [Tanacetum cinerariifolium]
MSRNDQHEIPVAYPPSMTMEKQGQLPPAPLGYPTNVVSKTKFPQKLKAGVMTSGNDATSIFYREMGYAKGDAK